MCVPLCMYNTSRHGACIGLGNLTRKIYGLGMYVHARTRNSRKNARRYSIFTTYKQQYSRKTVFWMIQNALYAHFNIRTVKICMGKVRRLKTSERGTPNLVLLKRSLRTY